MDALKDSSLATLIILRFFENGVNPLIADIDGK